MTAPNKAAPERYGNTRVSKDSGRLQVAAVAYDGKVPKLRDEPSAFKRQCFRDGWGAGLSEACTLLSDVANAYAAQGNMIAATAIHDAALCLDVLAEVEQGDLMPLDEQMEWEPDGVCKYTMHTHFGTYKYDRSSGDAQTEGWVRAPNGECLGRHISSAFAKRAVIDDMRLKSAKAAAKNEVKG